MLGNGKTIHAGRKKMKANKKGELAMQYIADYPLYANTNGITYEQAIKIAKALSQDWQHELYEMERFEALSLEEKEKKLKKMGLIK